MVRFHQLGRSSVGFGDARLPNQRAQSEGLRGIAQQQVFNGGRRPLRHIATTAHRGQGGHFSFPPTPPGPACTQCSGRETAGGQYRCSGKTGGVWFVDLALLLQDDIDIACANGEAAREGVGVGLVQKQGKAVAGKRVGVSTGNQLRDGIAFLGLDRIKVGVVTKI